MTKERKIWLALQSAKTDIVLAITEHTKLNRLDCMEWVDQATKNLMEAYALLREDNKGGYEL